MRRWPMPMPPRESGPNERDVYSIRAQIYRAMGRTSEANRDEVRKEQLSC